MILGWLSEKAMASHFSTLAWKIPWTEQPGGPQSMRSLRVGQDWATSLSLFTFMYWRRKWQPTPVFLRIPGMGEPRGLLSMGSHRVGHDWSDLATAAAAAAGWLYGWGTGDVIYQAQICLLNHYIGLHILWNSPILSFFPLPSFSLHSPNTHTHISHTQCVDSSAFCLCMNVS